MSWLTRLFNRSTYTLLLRLGTPLLLLRLFLRGRKEAAYTQRIGQRLGFYAGLPAVQGAVWLHAVSLGEMRTAGLLLAQWRAQNPTLKILLTCSTATGWAEGEKLRTAAPEHTKIVWLPWDMPGAVDRFLQYFKPRLGLLMETEVWPNICHISQKFGLPLLLINGRMSEKSLNKALRLPRLALPAYASLAGVLAQSADDAARFKALHAQILGISGNIKFDIAPNKVQIEAAHALKQRWAPKKIITLASSREGEEALFLQALASTPDASPDLDGCQNSITPMIVPRHPQRFAEIAQMAADAGWRVLRRAEFDSTATLSPKTLLLGDSMGEMAFYYTLSDYALMGGSFLPFGGQNLIEALACHCPVVLGPHTYNFAQASQEALEAGLAQNAADLSQAWDIAQKNVKTKDSSVMQDKLQSYFARNQGGIQRTLAAIDTYLK